MTSPSWRFMGISQDWGILSAGQKDEGSEGWVEWEGNMRKGKAQHKGCEQAGAAYLGLVQDVPKSSLKTAKLGDAESPSLLILVDKS